MSGKPGMLGKPLLVRLFAKRSIDAVTGCWNFTGARGRTGYGHTTLDGKPQRFTTVHRASYMALVGPIPDGHHVHHLCANPSCFNPEHLQTTTVKRHLTELTPRSIAFRNSRKTHCMHGHPLAGDNLYTHRRGDGVRRYCVTCRIAATERSEAKKRAQRIAS